MLEMMPGSIVDKTNNNLSNLTCTHSTFDHRRNLGKENIMEAPEAAEMSVSCSNLHQNNCKETVEYDINEELSDDIESDRNISTHNQSEGSIISQESNPVSKETAECSFAVEKSLECIVDFGKPSECNILSKSTNQCDDIAQETLKCNISSVNVPECHLRSSAECNIPQITSECDVSSEPTACNIIPKEAAKYNIISSNTTDCNIDSSVITKCNIASSKTATCDMNSPKTTVSLIKNECTAASNETTYITTKNTFSCNVAQNTAESNFILNKTLSNNNVSQEKIHFTQKSIDDVAQEIVENDFSQESFEVTSSDASENEDSSFLQATIEIIADSEELDNFITPRSAEQCSKILKETNNDDKTICDVEAIVTNEESNDCSNLVNFNVNSKNESTCNDVSEDQTFDVSDETVCNINYEETFNVNIVCEQSLENIVSEETPKCESVLEEITQNINSNVTNTTYNFSSDEPTVISQETSDCSETPTELIKRSESQKTVEFNNDSVETNNIDIINVTDEFEIIGGSIDIKKSINDDINNEGIFDTVPNQIIDRNTGTINYPQETSECKITSSQDKSNCAINEEVDCGMEIDYSDYNSEIKEINDINIILQEIDSKRENTDTEETAKCSVDRILLIETNNRIEESDNLKIDTKEVTKNSEEITGDISNLKETIQCSDNQKETISINVQEIISDNIPSQETSDCITNSEKIIGDHMYTRKITEDDMDEEKVNEDHMNEEKITEDDMDKEQVTEDYMDTEKITEDQMDREKVTEDHMDKEKITEDNMDKEKVIEDRMDTAKITEDYVDKGTITEDYIYRDKKTEDDMDKEKVTEVHMDTEKISEDDMDEEKVTEDHMDTEKITGDYMDKEKITEDHIYAEKIIEDDMDKEKIVEDHMYTKKTIENCVDKEKITEDHHIYTDKITEDDMDKVQIVEDHMYTKKIMEECVDKEKKFKDHMYTGQITEDHICTEKITEDYIDTENVTEDHTNTEGLTEDDIDIEIITECNINLKETSNCGFNVEEKSNHNIDVGDENIIFEIMPQETHNCSIDSKGVVEDNDDTSETADSNTNETIEYRSDAQHTEHEIFDSHINSEENFKNKIVPEQTVDDSSDFTKLETVNEGSKIDKEIIINNNSKSKIIKPSINKQEKLNTFLKEYNLTTDDLIPKIKKFKRLTKDKRKPNRILSLKLNRHYFKSYKPKWSNRISSNKKELVNNYLTNKKQQKKQKSLKHNLEEQENESSANSEEDNGDSSMLDFKADEDIRDKIKEQLELLRKNKKLTTKPNEEKPKTPEHQEKSAEGTNETLNPDEMKQVEENMTDAVLHRGDYGLSIVSVVGGYCSDEEQQNEAIESQNTPENISAQEKTNKGISMTDILLQRDFSQVDKNLIRLTKTVDVTKIKGWKTKQFSPVTIQETSEEDTPTPDGKEEPTLTKSQPSIVNTIDNPIPSTSFDYKELQFPQVKADNILKQGENVDLNQDTNTKSAFVSDVLDTFLDQHSELKISYEVPKLVAEGAITKPATEMPVSNNDYLAVVDNNSYRKKSISNKVLKPKTLAEKRRMLENDRQKQLLHDMETNENIYLKELEYSEKRSKSDVAKDIRENLMTKDAPFSRRCWNMATKNDANARQFVLVNGNKIRILGSSGGKDIKVPKHNKINNKQKISYKPGPLSKKHKLITCHQNNVKWECHVLKMPKVKLVVHPEQGKRFPAIAEQYIQLYRGEKGIITDELAKFAVSAVRTSEPPKDKNKFEFDIPYKNGQNKLLVRKQNFNITSHDRMQSKRKNLQFNNFKNQFGNINVEDSIKSIMSDMLDCIENQDLDRIIIKEDPDLNNHVKNDKTIDRPPSPINPMIHSIIKRPNAKRSRATLELRRLNVQIIEVDVKEETISEEICTNDFCHLGCICKSLRGASSLVPEHCGRVNCMLECSCAFENSSRGTHSITLPAGTDVLSASTVVRLQDEVKRNLAKEEKEFTQTVIKTNNQTIMVGGGTRERSKRVTKLPKKYSNFVQNQKFKGGLCYEKMNSGSVDDDDFENQFSKSVIQKVKEDVKKVAELSPPVLEVKLRKPIPIWKKEREEKLLKLKNCQVRLTKLKLDHVATWCMVHNLYKCHCDGKSTFDTPVKQKPEEICIKDENEYISYSRHFKNNRSVPENKPVKPVSTVTDNSDRYCARTKGLSSNFYQARNKSQCYKARHASLKKQDNIEIISSEDNKKLVNVDSAKTELKEKLENNQDLLVPRPNKNIKIVNVSEILNQSKEDELKKPNSPHIVTAASFIDYDRSFLGLLTPSAEWLERFHKMLNLNMNTVIRQIRLLEWATLVRRQKSGSLQLWFNHKKYNNIVLTEDRKRPSKSHVNVRYFEANIGTLNNFRVPEIIKSLYGNKLPGAATKDTETYVILVYNGILWEARGTIVLSDTSAMCRQRLGHKTTPPSILNPVLYNQNNETLNKPEIVTKQVQNPNIIITSTSAISVEVVNTIPNKSPNSSKTDENKGLEITKVTQPNEQPKKETPILAPLPTGFGLNHWFMLKLKNDFSVLRISFSNFHIKYTHLITAIQTAQKNKKTVRIRSQDRNSGNKSNFGVYALPGFADKIFFGPYEDGTSHGLETFRYVNGKLVNTKIYNKMRGSMDRNTTGIWYFHVSTVQNNLILEPQTETPSSGSDCSTEITTAEKALKPEIEFVDLTENDSDAEAETTKSQESKNNSNVDPLFNVLSADFSKKVTGDITIEPVFDNSRKTQFLCDKKQKDVTIQAINEDRAKLTSLQQPERREISVQNEKKRKLDINFTPVPTKKQPTLIASIELDDDEDGLNSQNRRNLDKNSIKQIPGLRPLENVQNSNQEVMKKRKVTYVITNIPGIGYFEIFSTEKKCLRLDINGKATMFPTISMALTWLHQTLRKSILFMPVSLKVKFSILESTEVPEMPKFNQNYLNGCHMMCAKGIFDLVRMSTEEMHALGFNEKESTTLLSQKCEILIDRNIKILGSYLVGPEEASKLDKFKILSTAPKKIKLMETRDLFFQEQKEKLKKRQAELVLKINGLLMGTPDHFKAKIRSKVYAILDKRSRPAGDYLQNSTKLPSGNVKIADGKLSVVDPLRSRLTPVRRSFEMIVPISGLQTPVTVVGVPRMQPANSLLRNQKKSQQNVVDLTDD